MTTADVRPRWQRPDPDLSDYRPVYACPAPARPDPGPARAPAAVPSLPAAGAPAVAYAPVPAPARPAPRAAPGRWQPASPGPAARSVSGVPAGPVPVVTWCRPPAPGIRPASQGRPQVTTAPAWSGGPCSDSRHASPCTGDINYDPPEWSAGTGLQSTNPDGSWVVHPLSVIEPGCDIGDEGPINEAFLSSPVVYLAAGRPYALASHVVIPDGATLYLNRAAIDRDMFVIGEGATVHD